MGGARDAGAYSARNAFVGENEYEISLTLKFVASTDCGVHGKSPHKRHAHKNERRSEQTTWLQFLPKLCERTKDSRIENEL